MKSIPFQTKSKKILKAFTVLELIIVVVIIGILSAVVYVGYGSVKSQARDASVLSDLDTLDSLMTAYALKNNVVGKAIYLENGAVDSELGFTPSEGNVIDAVIDSSDYCLRGYNSDGTKNSITNAYEKESSEGACDRIPPSATAMGGLPVGVTVTGGSVTIDGAYTVRTFTSSGTLSVTNGTLTGVSVLVVGGGYNGNPGNGDDGGPGGPGGEVVYLTNQTLTGDTSVTVLSYAGNTIFGSTTARQGATGIVGAAGGVAGINGGVVNGGTGSNGYSSNISGSTKYYGSGGGGGGAWQQGVGGLGGDNGGGAGGANIMPHLGDDYGQDGAPGAPNTGGGGGGGGGGTDDGNGGSGGTGVVIVRYLTP